MRLEQVLLIERLALQMAPEIYGYSRMSPDDNKQELDRLQQLNDELSSSLKRCRRLLHDYEVRLTANSNDAETPGTAQESREA